MRTLRYASILAILSTLALTSICFAAPPDRITGPILAEQTVRLAAGVPLQARSEFDQGAVDPSFKLTHMTLLTVPSAAQRQALTRLLAQQQDPHSAYYHKWLTPEQYADRFGLSQNDIRKLATWLQSQGFTVVSAARGRNWIVFTGTAAQVEKAFQTRIHGFDVDGKTHFANTTPVAIPAALSGIVTGVRGLSNFGAKSYAHRSKPGYTFPVTGGDLHYIAPGDVATMYDINALYNNGFDGGGQKLAVMGQTDVYLNDLVYFRSGFGLSTSGYTSCTTNGNNVITACDTTNFQYVYIDTIADPGAPNSIGDDLPEADIDLEWSSGTARNALIIYVNAPDPNGGGVWDSWYYAVDNTVAPVITLSYGLCELAEAQDSGTGEFTFLSDEAELQQANSEGITFMNSSADQGAALCDYRANVAVNGYAVSYPASSPEVTGVGGTLIPYTEYTSAYWNTTNGPDGGSAKKYIQEEGWNDAQEWSIYCTNNSTAKVCVNNPGLNDWLTAQESYVGIWASGGGVSNCTSINTTTGACQGGFAQPSWQAGISASAINPSGFGVTNTPARYSPDVSLLSSIYWPGYLLCTAADELGGSDTTSSCSPGGAQGIVNDQTNYGFSWGGTSVAAPIFAGIVTLLNQYAVTNGIQSTPGLGNINPLLYQIAATPSNGAFNPVITANTGAYSDGAFCTAGTPSVQPTALQCPSTGTNAGFLGFNTYDSDATTNYNLVTGLGSVDVSKLFTAWAAAALATTATAVTSNDNPANFGDSVTFTATVTTAGTTAPTGTVTFNDGTTALGTGSLSTQSGSQVATYSTSSLAAGSHSITAVYAGDTSNGTSTSVVLTQVVNAPTLNVSTPSTPAAVAAGLQTTSTFTVTPTGTGVTKFGGAVTLSCGGLPDTTVSCSFSTNPIPAGAGSTSETLTITTSGPNTASSGVRRNHADNRAPWLPLTLPLAGIVMVGLAGRRISRYSAIAGLCASLLLLGLLLACGNTKPVAISVSPAGATVWASEAAWPPQTATFTATLSNTNNTGVNWTVTTTNGGSITSAGVYTAPTAAAGLPASATIMATSQADTSKTATATVTITPTSVPGTYPLTVTATEGPTQNTTNSFNLTVQ